MDYITLTKTDAGFTLVLNATIRNDHIIPHPTETVTFETDNCWFIYDLMGIDSDTTYAKLTINDKPYWFANPLWKELEDACCPHAIMEFDALVLKNQAQEANPNILN